MLVQPQAEESMEFHISTNKNDCKGGDPSIDRPVVGGDSKSLVDISVKGSVTEGGTTGGLGDKPTHIPNSIPLRGEPVGEANREENARNHVDLNQYHEQQKLHEAPLDLSANSGV